MRRAGQSLRYVDFATRSMPTSEGQQSTRAPSVRQQHDYTEPSFGSIVQTFKPEYSHSFTPCCRQLHSLAEKWKSNNFSPSNSISVGWRHTVCQRWKQEHVSCMCNHQSSNWSSHAMYTRSMRDEKAVVYQSSCLYWNQLGIHKICDRNCGTCLQACITCYSNSPRQFTTAKL